ncbi:Uncharacterized protein GY17_00000863 [Cryptosporidium hominis]|uniref:Uncharacterized protein n=1 Tax=Cryptosporidium hominis TaxID=237895 RepID=A0ABX5BIH6_CRYHO|nr:Uncharacterized protein GY17_00000863 [Cryptosporidium hominis]|eukprot:PPS98184.1 Uncharacterized protein GY17_00000863 [Cryptosporidium hominis]
MAEIGHNRRAKRYALEICQWLDGILKDESVDESIEYEMNNTVEGLSRQLVEVKKINEEYKKELEELNSRYLEMSEYLSVKNKLQEVIQEYEEYKSENERRIYQLEKRNEELQEEKARLELRGRSLEEGSREVLKKNEELIRSMEEKVKEVNQKVHEKIEIEKEFMKKEEEYKSLLDSNKIEKTKLEGRCIQLEEMLEVKEKELKEGFSREIGEKELKIQSLNEECMHNKYRITELEKLLKMAENEQLVSKNYRSLIEQYKNRLLVLENSEKSYQELQEKWSNQERLVKQQSQRLEQAEGWLKRMVELEQENSTLSQQIKQWETMAYRYTHNLKVLNRESTGGQIKDESDELGMESQTDSVHRNSIYDNDSCTDNHLDSDNKTTTTQVSDEKKRKVISPTSVLSAIFEFQRRYQDVLVSKTVIETSKTELENKVDTLESKLQVCQREIKYYEDELSSKSEEIQRMTESSKRLECEIKVLKECLSKESKSTLIRGEVSFNGKVGESRKEVFGIDVNKEGSNINYYSLNDDSQKEVEGSKERSEMKQSIDIQQDLEERENVNMMKIEAQKKDLDEKMKIITHLESELKLRNEEIKTYWSIRVAYDTLTQERDSLLESSNSLQEYNKELKSQLVSLNEKLKIYELSSKPSGETNLSHNNFVTIETNGKEDTGELIDGNESYSILRDKYYEEQRRNQTLSEYYIKERSNLMDAISNILGWRIEIIYVEGGLTAYKLSNIFSSHGGELIFVIRPAPSMGGEGGNNGGLGGGNPVNTLTTTFLLTNENMVSEAADMEEQLTLDFIGYYANKFEEDSNWALQLTATQSYPAFMAYTCLEEFHNTNIENIVDTSNSQQEQVSNRPLDTLKKGNSNEKDTNVLESPNMNSLSGTTSDGILLEEGPIKTKRLREDTSWIHPRE